MIIRHKLTLAAVFFCLTLSGCIGMNNIMHPPGVDGVEQSEHEMVDLKAQQIKDFEHRQGVFEEDGMYISGDILPFMKGSQIPDHFNPELVIVEPPLELQEIAQRLTEIARIPIQVSPRLADYMKKAEQDDEKAYTSGGSQRGTTHLALNYEGKLSRLLDIVSAYYGIFWEFDAGVVDLYRTKTKTFTLTALPGEININDIISNKTEVDSQSGGDTATTGSSSQSNGQTTTVAMTLIVWDEIIGNVRSMLSLEGKAVGNPSAGTVSVTDSPTVLAQVNKYVSQINDRLSKQVSISVKVYSFESDNTVDTGANLDPVFQDLENSFRGTIQSAQPLNMDGGAGNLLATILNTTSDSHSGWGSQWEGSTMLLQALKRHGKVGLVTSGSGITLNNQPLPIQNISKVGYLKSVSVTSTVDVGTETELEAGEVSTGFSMLAVPHILDNNRVALQYSISLSSLDDMKTIQSGENMIQLPEISTRAFMQRVGMKLGSTLVLAGFEQERNENTKGRGLFGFMSNGQKKRNAIIVVISVNDVTGA